MSQSKFIKESYKEHPDVDVLELSDGTYIGVSGDCICYYDKELFEDGVCHSVDQLEDDDHDGPLWYIDEYSCFASDVDIVNLRNQTVLFITRDEIHFVDIMKTINNYSWERNAE